MSLEEKIKEIIVWTSLLAKHTKKNNHILALDDAHTWQIS
jgi:hypothetical protein